MSEFTFTHCGDTSKRVTVSAKNIDLARRKAARRFRAMPQYVKTDEEINRILKGK